jgi:hypothetical protein
MEDELKERVAVLEKELLKVKKRSIWVFGTIAIIFSFFNSLVISRTDSFKKIFDDLLDGEPLPIITEFILSFGNYLMYANLVLPVIVIWVCLRKVEVTPVLLGSLIISLAIELFFVIVAFFAPMFFLINSM